MHASFEFLAILPNRIEEGVDPFCLEREGCRPNQGAKHGLLIQSMDPIQRFVADFQSVNEFPAPSLRRSALELNA